MATHPLMLIAPKGLGLNLSKLTRCVTKSLQVAMDHRPKSWDCAHYVINNIRFSAAREERTIVPITDGLKAYCVTGVNPYPSGRIAKPYVIHFQEERYVAVLDTYGSRIIGQIEPPINISDACRIHPVSGDVFNYNSEGLRLSVGVNVDHIVQVKLRI